MIVGNPAAFLQSHEWLIRNTTSQTVEVMESIDYIFAWLDGASNEKFSEVVAQIRSDVDRSGYRLAEVADMDRTYLSRLERGSKDGPSRTTVLKIGAALVRLGADILVVDRLLLAAGLLPIFLIAGVPITPPPRPDKDSRTK